MIPADELIRDVPGATEADEAALLEAERGAVAFVETQTGRYFGPPELVTEYVDGGGSGRLYLADHVTHDPADYDAAVAVVSIEERALAGDDPTAVTTFELRQTDREAVLIRYAGDPWTRPYEYAVTYWRGYQEGEEPADVRQLVKDLVSVRWALRGMTGLRSETIGGYSYTRFGDTDVDACSGGWSTIELWRRPVAV